MKAGWTCRLVKSLWNLWLRCIRLWLASGLLVSGAFATGFRLALLLIVTIVHFIPVVNLLIIQIGSI